LMGLAAMVPVAAMAGPGAARAKEAQKAVERLMPDGRLPVNRERAYRMMKAAGVDAIIGATDANSFYLTNVRSVLSEMGLPRLVIGIMPADPSKPIVAVMPGIDIGRLSGAERDVGREWPEVVTWTAPVDRAVYESVTKLDADAMPEAAPSQGWPKSATGALTPIEMAWESLNDSLPMASAATPALGVKKALADLGLTRARVAVDDGSLVEDLRRVGLDDLKIVPGDNLFLKIRHVKSAVEIDRMRTVTRLNDGAARAMIANLRPDMSFEEVQALFFGEVAKRGGRPEFIVAGMTSGLRHGRTVPHEPFLVDCCGNFDGYSGDFARTVVLGAPSQLLMDRSKMLGRLAAEITGILKPGISYSQIRARGGEMAKKLGMNYSVGVGPHAVGLTHSDDPRGDGMPIPAREDVVLEPGMVLTVDLPTLEPGWGSMHLESLILITADGAEWLDRFDDPLYEVSV